MKKIFLWPAFCGVVLAGLFSPGRAAADNVTINLSSTITTMPANGIGVNASVYYNNFADNTWIPGQLDAAGVTIVRYPGGSYSDGYHFATNSGQGLYVGPNMDFNSFEQVLQTGAPKGTIITVDYGSNLTGTMGGQPQEAAAWVALADGNASLYNSGHDITIGNDAGGVNWGTVGYWAHLRTLTVAQANADPNYNGLTPGTPAYSIGESLNGTGANLSFLGMNHAASYNIQDWEIGNELFGNGYFGTDQNWETDQHYTGTGASRQGQAALSPTAYGTNVNAFVTAMRAVDPAIQIGVALDDDPAWDPGVLQKSGANINYGIVHYYPTAGNSNGTASPATDSSFIASQKTAIPSVVAGQRSLINANAGSNAANIAINVTEFGNFGTLNNPNVYALYATEAYAAFLESGVQNVDVWEMMTKNFFDTDSQSATPVEGPSYFGTVMMHELASPGDTFVSTTSNTSTMLTHAVVRPNGQVVVLLINAGLSTDSVSVNLGSGSYLSSGTLYSTNGSANVAASSVSGLGSAFTVSVPSFTEYAYVLTPTPGPPMNWTNADGTGSWNLAGNWNSAGGPPNLPGTTAVFATTSPTGTVTLDGNQSVGFLQFNNGASGSGMTINAGSPAGTLTLDNGGGTASILVSAGQHAINTPIALNSPLSINITTTAAGTGLTIGGLISNGPSDLGNSISLSGGGTLTLSATNAYTGGTTISGGKLTTTGNGTLGSGPVSIASGATLQLASSVSGLSATMNVANAGTLSVSSSVKQIAGTITGAGSTSLGSGAILTAYQLRQNSLSIGSGATVSLVPSGSGSTTNPALPNNINFSSSLTSLSIAGTTGAWTGTLDIGNNGLAIAYGSGADPYSTIDNMIASGYNGGVWGGKGITSTLAQAGVAKNIGAPLNIGLVDFTPGSGNYTNATFIMFEGQTIATSAVLVRLTYMDDLVLAGDMSANDSTSDALLFAANYGAGTTWSVGDLTHDRVIDSNDALLFAANFQTSFPSLDGTTGGDAAQAGAAVVPEPSSIMLAALAMVTIVLLTNAALKTQA